MKFLHIIPALLALCALTSCGGNDTDALFESFRHEPQAEYVHVPRFLLKTGLSMASLSADGAEERQALRLASKIDGMRVLTLDECSPVVKERFRMAVSHLEEEGYECMVRVSDDSDKVRVFARRNGESIRELLVAVTSEDAATLVQVNGKIAADEIGKIVQID